MSTYVMGDLHGQVEAFNRMLDKIKFNRDLDKLYLVGDYTDGWGSNGSELIIQLASMRKQGCLFPVLGNHDDMMIYTIHKYENCIKKYGEADNSWVYDQMVMCWMNNMGMKSLEQYIKQSDRDKQIIKDFLDTLPLYEIVSIGKKKYYIAHAEVYTESGAYRRFGKEYTVWGNPKNKFISRLTTEIQEVLPGATLITGHRITISYIDYPYNTNEPSRIIKVPDKNRILVDCGCKGIQLKDKYALGCLRLDDMKEYYITRRELTNKIDSILDYQ